MSVTQNTEAARESARQNDGKFGHQHHAEASGVSLAPAPQQMNQWRAPDPNKVIDGQLSAYEAGLRTDDNGVLAFRMSVGLGDLQRRRANDLADEHLLGAAYTDRTELIPVGVVDGRVIVEAHVHDVDSHGGELNASDSAEFERGRADRQAWLDKIDFTPPAAELNEFIPAGQISDLHPVPAFPEGTPDGTYISSGEKDGVQRVALCAPDDGVVASFRYAPGELENYEEFNVEGEGEFDSPAPVPEWVDENREEVREILESVARNRVRLYEHAEMRTRWVRGLDQRVAELAVVGNPDGEEF